MPTAALRPCLQPGCPALVTKGRCATHGARPNADARRAYHTARWQRLRAQVLREQPCCQECRSRGRVVMSTDVDHIVPHRGDEDLFWARSNLQGLCHGCHSAKTRSGA